MTRYGAVGQKSRLIRECIRRERRWAGTLGPEQAPPGGFECGRKDGHRGRHIAVGTRIPVIHAWPGEYHPGLLDLWRLR